MRTRLPHPRHAIELAIAFIAVALLPGLRLAPEVGGRLGDVQPVAAVALCVATALLVLRVRGPLDRWSIGLLIAEGALVATVGRSTLAMWSVVAVWSLFDQLARPHAESGPGVLSAPKPKPRLLFARAYATAAVVRGALAGFVALELITGGVEARGGTTGFADVFADPYAVIAALGAAAYGIGSSWGVDFTRIYRSAGGERAWLLWILWPSLGAIAAAYIARERLPTWALLVLIALTLATIMGHALVATQRPRAEVESDAGSKQLGPHLDEPPTGGLLEAVEFAPLASMFLVSVALAVAGVLELVT